LKSSDSNVNVNCVLPSIADTPENRAAMPDADFARWVTPDALAEVIAFLASDGTPAIHGATIPVVGLSCRRSRQGSWRPALEGRKNDES
jgi:NAD(P)-dependent dehydrogenase (short-subunit alcohol dehydrogenase family)